MPRIKQNYLQYKAVDFVKYLTGEMETRELYQRDIAEILDISQFAVSKKIRSRRFSYEDKMRIFEALDTPYEEKARLLL